MYYNIIYIIIYVIYVSHIPMCGEIPVVSPSYSAGETQKHRHRPAGSDHCKRRLSW